jgi:hypothetical protein
VFILVTWLFSFVGGFLFSIAAKSSSTQLCDPADKLYGYGFVEWKMDSPFSLLITC